MRAAPLAFAAVVGALVGLSGCAEKPQEKSVRKSDATAFSGSTDPAYAASGWTAGDKTSWESQIRDRNKGQNEYGR